jgi:glycosyltransferase involved in cell wall biosynthesis
VTRIVRASDIGVLSSESEGFPLALIEYGQAGVAAVATDVGQCREILDHGRAGTLVPASDPQQLARALTQLLLHHRDRRRLAAALEDRVRDRYASGRLVEQICGIYDSVRPLNH